LLNEVADGSVELIQDLAEIFFKQASIFSQQLDELYKNKDFTALGKLAHKIKGSVSTLGMDKLADNMKELENLAKLGIKQEEYPEMIENYKTISGEAVIELNELLKRL
jgi:HPt (histidine-containing phosphotransfer) domain-containing protein